LKKTGLLKFLIGAGLFVFLSGCTRQPRATLAESVTPEATLHREIHYLVNTPAFANAHWGVAIQSLKTGEYFYLQNENKGFMPASNMKLFTTATAISQLGSDFVFETRVYQNGKLDAAGTLLGDLVVRGVGDPTIGGRYSDSTEPDRMEAVFREWAQKLKNQGVRAIQGNIVGDDNFFSDQPLGFGWSWDDESEWYAAQISALSFNDNCVDIFFDPAGKTDALASFKLYPETDYVSVKNYVTTAVDGLETGIYFNRKRAGNDVTITGSISEKRSNVADWFSVENPTAFFVTVFKKVLIEQGIKISGHAFDIDSLENYQYVLADSTELLRQVSPPLKEIIKTVNKESQNLWTELLLRTLGAKFRGVGDDVHGIEVVKSFLEGVGIAPGGIGIADGSGLSRHNLITPMQVITLLRYMRTHKNSQNYYDSLPIAGIDGTIKHRMAGTAAQNNVHAKTGYINRVRALSGYVTTKDGEEIIFSLIVNNYLVPTSMANNVQDQICARLANFSRKQEQ
jgi:D-alanyl-D-alanine carboxypeptidase/D-alanyl-D-alanine-endopeptidase (penicillin-binding protein 4)